MYLHSLTAPAIELTDTSAVTTATILTTELSDAPMTTTIPTVSPITLQTDAFTLTTASVLPTTEQIDTTTHTPTTTPGIPLNIVLKAEEITCLPFTA